MQPMHQEQMARFFTVEQFFFVGDFTEVLAVLPMTGSLRS